MELSGSTVNTKIFCAPPPLNSLHRKRINLYGCVPYSRFINCFELNFLGKQTTHFIAPCEKAVVKECVKKQMTSFFTWLNQRQENKPAESGYVRAAITKLWFVTIHPLDDGNGRFSRIIAEYCLAQTEGNRNEYYEILEATQRGNLDITRWIIWFLQQVNSAAQTAMILLNRINRSTQFWDQHRHTVFNPRQQKLLQKMLEEYSVLHRIYGAL